MYPFFLKAAKYFIYAAFTNLQIEVLLVRKEDDLDEGQKEAPQHPDVNHHYLGGWRQILVCSYEPDKYSIRFDNISKIFKQICYHYRLFREFFLLIYSHGCNNKHHS